MDVTIKVSFGGGAQFVPMKAAQCYMKPKKLDKKSANFSFSALLT